jgi:hypothetical protein
MTQRDNNRTVNEIKAMMAEDGDFLRPASSVLWLRELSKIITHSITHRIAWRALTCRIFFPQQDSPTPREQGSSLTVLHSERFKEVAPRSEILRSWR